MILLQTSPDDQLSTSLSRLAISNSFSKTIYLSTLNENAIIRLIKYDMMEKFPFISNLLKWNMEWNASCHPEFFQMSYKNTKKAQGFKENKMQLCRQPQLLQWRPGLLSRCAVYRAQGIQEICDTFRLKLRLYSWNLSTLKWNPFINILDPWRKSQIIQYVDGTYFLTFY